MPIARQSSQGKPWFSVYSFVGQAVIATVGSMLSGWIVIAVIAFLIALMTRTSNQHVLYKMADLSIVNLGADEPYFVAPIFCGFVLGWISHRWFKSQLAVWVWIPTALILVWNIFTWQSYGPLSHWADVRANFFTSHCGGSDCLYELFVTGPFYTSVAYSCGWMLQKLQRRLR